MDTIEENEENEESIDTYDIDSQQDNYLFQIDVKSDTDTVSSTGDIFELKLDDEDEQDEHVVRFTPELFILLLNKLTESLLIIGVFLLVIFLISDSYHYNFFPFKINNANGWMYQGAQIIGLVSYAMSNIIILRILSILSYALFIIWTLSIGDTPSIDYFLFTYMNVVINIKKIAELIYRKRKITFDDLREQIYVNTFSGFMSRDEFKELTNTALIRELPKGAFYCKLKDKCNSLSILIDGRIRVYKNSENIKTTFINENEFIDSAEWLLRYQNKPEESKTSTSNKKIKIIPKKPRGKRFNYFMKADDDCIYMTWPREILREQMKKNSDLEQKLTGILGIDVSTKLFNNASLY